jgi:hypothetical protein
MNITSESFRQIAAVAGVSANLTADEGRALVAIVRLAIDADEREDDDELVAADDIIAHACALAQIDVPPAMELPHDDVERDAMVRDLAEPLRGTPAGALAYLVAYLVSIADFDIAPVEGWLVDRVRETVGLDPDRAREVAAAATEVITPPEE